MKALDQRRHWIFDMDDTLTQGVHDFVWMREQLGLAPGAPILETLAALPAAEAEPLWAKVNEMELHFAGLAQPMPGVHQLLQRLQQQGVKLGIITRNVMHVAQRTLQRCGIDHFFSADTLLDRDACTPKPSPDGIHRLLHHWGAEADDAVMVGDFLFDLQAGRGAGVATVHIDPKGEFRWPDQADLMVRELGQILP